MLQQDKLDSSHLLHRMGHRTRAPPHAACDPLPTTTTTISSSGSLTVALKVEERVPDERDRDQISSPQASKMPSPLKAHVRRPQGEKQAFFSKKKEEEGKKKPPYRPRSQSELLPKHPSFHLPHADFNPSNLAFSTLSSSTGGASSYVLRAYYQGYGAVAVKVIDISKCGLRSQLETELQAIKGGKVTHRCLVNLLGVYMYSSTKVGIVMTYMDCGSVHDAIARQGGALPTKDIQHITHETLLALRYITGNKIAHNDIKPRNILLNSQQQVRVCDYGLVAELGPASGEEAKRGTCRYMSPERLLHGQMDSCSDIFSLGLVVLVMAKGSERFLPGPFDLITEAAASFQFDRANLEDTLVDFIDCCLHFKPSQRATAEQLLSHPFLLSYDENKSQRGRRGSTATHRRGKTPLPPLLESHSRALLHPLKQKKKEFVHMSPPSRAREVKTSKTWQVHVDHASSSSSSPSKSRRLGERRSPNRQRRASSKF